MGSLRRISVSQALGYLFFSYCFFFKTILTSPVKVLCLQMMTSRVTGKGDGDGDDGARDASRLELCI